MYDNDTELVFSLLRAGAGDVNDVEPNEGASRLSWALRTSKFDMAQLLVDFGVDIEMRDDEGWNVLQNACEHDELAQVRWLVAIGADVDARTNGLQLTPLMCAENNADVARFLLACGADVDLLDSAGKSALERIDVDACDDDQSYASLLYAAGATQRSFEVAPGDLRHQIDANKRALARERIGLIRQRAVDICIGVQSLRWPAWVTLQVVELSCEPLSACVPLAAKWAIVTTVKHCKKV